MSPNIILSSKALLATMTARVETITWKASGVRTAAVLSRCEETNESAAGVVILGPSPH